MCDVGIRELVERLRDSDATRLELVARITSALYELDAPELQAMADLAAELIQADGKKPRAITTLKILRE